MIYLGQYSELCPLVNIFLESLSVSTTDLCHGNTSGPKAMQDTYILILSIYSHLLYLLMYIIAGTILHHISQCIE